jgi:Na+-transporting NADH:ubiquinone oxidoreductase subunit NqrF
MQYYAQLNSFFVSVLNISQAVVNATYAISATCPVTMDNNDDSSTTVVCDSNGTVSALYLSAGLQSWSACSGSASVVPTITSLTIDAASFTSVSDGFQNCFPNLASIHIINSGLTSLNYAGW